MKTDTKKLAPVVAKISPKGIKMTTTHTAVFDRLNPIGKVIDGELLKQIAQQGWITPIDGDEEMVKASSEQDYFAVLQNQSSDLVEILYLFSCVNGQTIKSTGTTIIHAHFNNINIH